MVNLAEMDRQDFLRFLGVAFGSAVLASCRLKPPPPETHIPSKEPIQGQIGNMDSTVAAQPLSGDQQQNSRKITMESTIDVNSITVENPLEGLEVRTLKLNDFFTVTFLMTEHHLEDVENKEKMKKIKEAIESSSCVIPEYYPPAIEEMKKSSFWVNFIADPDEKFIPFFSKLTIVRCRRFLISRKESSFIFLNSSRNFSPSNPKSAKVFSRLALYSKTTFQIFSFVSGDKNSFCILH